MKNTDCYDYVRRNYGVPAYIGVRVRDGKHEGVIVAAKSDLHYVHVVLDGATYAVPSHPKDWTYIVEGAGEFN